MQVRNKETGEVETLRHGPATDAVTAGTHEFVNIKQDDDDTPRKGKEKPSKTSQASA